MNILYIDHYAGSLSMGMEFRPYYLAREWKKQGHNVRIIAAGFAHLRKVNPVVKTDFEISCCDGIEYQWIKTREYHGNGIARVLSICEFCGKLKVRAGKISEEFKPDIVIASSTYPMDTYAARSIAMKSGAKYIHEVHDMWPITPIELYGMSPSHPFIRIVQNGENYFCKNADKVVSILPCAKDYFIEHGMKADKFVYIPNGIDLDDWNQPERLPQEHQVVLEDAHKQGRFILAFYGSHTKSYSLDYLLKAIAQMDQSKIFVIFVGEGNYKTELMKMARDLKIDTAACAFMPSINKKAIPSLIKESDASYVGAIKNRMFRFGIGMNKLFDAMMGGKPILYAVDAPNDLVQEYQCGVSVGAEDVDALKNGFTGLLNSSEDERSAMGENGRKAVLENFNYPVLAERFINSITEV